MFVSWLHDPASDRLSIRAWAVGEDMAKDCGTLEVELEIAKEKIAALTHERDHLRTTLGFWQGQHFERVVRERDENEEIAKRALAMGLDHAELARSGGCTWHCPICT